MTEFGSDAGLPGSPTPPPPPPFGTFGAPAAPSYTPGYPPQGYGAPGYPPQYGSMQMQKPPRPPVRVGSTVLAVGGLVMIIGSFLEWYTLNGESRTGMDPEYFLYGRSNSGPVFVFLGVLAVGFGIAQFAARKVLAVAICAVVFASFGALGVLAEVSEQSDVADLAEIFGDQFSSGPGLWVVLAGAAAALGGAIATLSARRRWPKQA